MGYSDLSLRRKHVWLFRGDGTDIAAVRSLAAAAVAERDATEAALDVRFPAPRSEEERPSGPRRVVALLHLYDIAPSRVAPLRAQADALGGEAYDILERVVFDRRKPEHGEDGWYLVGTQTRQDRLSREEFVRHWGIGHAEKLRAYDPAVVRYTQNYVVAHDPAVRDFDGFFQAYLPEWEGGPERLQATPEQAALVAADAASFLDEEVTEWIWVKKERFGPDWSDFNAR